jgi:hypothetical protein
MGSRAHAGDRGHMPQTARPAQPPATTPAHLEAEFPGWHVWRTTDAGTWWATQRGRTWAEPRTLAADSADALRSALRQARTGQ